MADRPLQLLGIARKGGNAVIGDEPVGAAAAGGKARLIILAADAASHTRRRANSYGALHNTPVISIGADKGALGSIFGRSSVAMAALTDIRLARAFLEALEPREEYDRVLLEVSRKADDLDRRKRNRVKR